MSPAEQLFPVQKPKILLLNFTEAETAPFVARNYNFERGWMFRNGYNFPSPGYEYDIVIAKFDKFGSEESRKLSQYGTDDWEDINALNETLRKFNGFALVFTPEDDGSIISLNAVGLDNLDLVDLDERDKEYTLTDYSDERFVGFSFVKALYTKYAKKLNIPFAQGIETRRDEVDPFLSIVTNANGQIVGGMGFHRFQDWNPTRGDYDNTFRPRCVVFPALKESYETVSIEILSQLPQWRPELFPTNERDWSSDDRYKSSETKRIEKEMETELKKFETRVTELEAERGSEYLKDSMLMQILIADDSDEFAPGTKMTDATLAVLKTLNFQVEDTSEVKENGKQRADILMKDPVDGFVAIVECKGTTAQNPPENYFGKITTHLLAKNGEVTRGVLVVNYDRKSDPFSRTPIYEDSPHIFDEEQKQIGILSTVELFKIVRDVQNGKLTKEQARAMIKQPGRIMHTAYDQS
jgi:hypothetical protein